MHVPITIFSFKKNQLGVCGQILDTPTVWGSKNLASLHWSPQKNITRINFGPRLKRQLPETVDRFFNCRVMPVVRMELFSTPSLGWRADLVTYSKSCCWLLQCPLSAARNKNLLVTALAARRSWQEHVQEPPFFEHVNLAWIIGV